MTLLSLFNANPFTSLFCDEKIPIKHFLVTVTKQLGTI